MMCRNFIFGSLLLSGFLGLSLDANAGFRGKDYGWYPETLLRLSGAKLKKGFEEGQLTLKNGAKFSVAKMPESHDPSFTIYDLSSRFIAMQSNNTDYIFYPCKTIEEYTFKCPKTKKAAFVLVLKKLP